MKVEPDGTYFKFVPLHRTYCFDLGGYPARTSVMVEINLPSGVKSDYFTVEVVDGSTVLLLTVKWPEYLLDPIKFNSSWLKKSEMLLESSRIISST